MNNREKAIKWLLDNLDFDHLSDEDLANETPEQFFKSLDDEQLFKLYDSEFKASTGYTFPGFDSVENDIFEEE